MMRLFADDLFGHLTTILHPSVGIWNFKPRILNGIVQKVSWSVHEDVDKYGINSPKVTVIYKEIGDEMGTS